MSSKPDAARMEFMLGELLATIHHDGGHYINEYGWETAYVDALERLKKLHLSLHGNHNYRVFYDNVINRILGDYGTSAMAEGPVVAGELAVSKALTAFDTLREFRSALLMEYRQGELVDNVPDVPPTSDGLMKAVRAMRKESADAAVLYERARVVNWLVEGPSEPLLEMAHADKDNPYFWLTVAIQEERHVPQFETI